MLESVISYMEVLMDQASLVIEKLRLAIAKDLSVGHCDIGVLNGLK